MSNGYPFDIWQGGDTSPVDPLKHRNLSFLACTLQSSICMEKRGFTGESIAPPLTSLQTIGTQRVRWFARLATIIHPLYFYCFIAMVVCSNSLAVVTILVFAV